MLPSELEQTSFWIAVFNALTPKHAVVLICALTHYGTIGPGVTVRCGYPKVQCPWLTVSQKLEKSLVDLSESHGYIDISYTIFT